MESYKRYSVETPVKVERFAIEDAYAIVRYVLDDLKDVETFFLNKQELAERNHLFYRGEQWTGAEKQMHEMQRRVPYVFNEVMSKVDHIIGSQVQTRLDIKAVGREPGDEGAAQLLTYLLKWVTQVNDLEDVETRIFQKGIIGGWGVAVVYWELEEVPYGYPRIEYAPANEFYWDATAIEPDLSDARWMARVSLRNRRFLKERYPMYADQIDECSTDGVYTNSGGSVQSVVRTKNQQLSTNAAYYMSQSDKDTLEHIEYFEKVNINRYTIFDDISGETNSFDNRNEAVDYYSGLIDAYSEAGTSIIDENGIELVVFVTEQVPQLIQTIIIGGELIYNGMTTLPDFPYVVFFPYFDEGDFWAFVDVLIYPQILLNRSFSQWDYILGASNKNAVTVMESLLKKGMTVENIRDEWSRTSPIFPVLSHDAIRPMPNIQVNPQLFQNITYANQRMEVYAGGKNALGLQENAAESGAAVQARAEAGGIGKLTVFDRLKIWKKGVAIRATWYIKNYMSARQIIRLLGDEEDVSYIDMDDGIFDTLREIKTDITIDEAVKTEAMKERHLQQALQATNLLKLPDLLAADLVMEYLPLPDSKKEKIRSMLPILQEAEQKAAAQAAEQKMQQEVDNAVKKKQMKDAKILGDELAASTDEIRQKAKEITTETKNLEAMRQKADEAAAKDQLLLQLKQQQLQQGSQGIL